MPHADPNVRREYLRQWKQRNRGRYAERDKAWSAAHNANRRARLYGAPGVITPDQAKKALQANRCHWCGTTAADPWWTLDHVRPLHAGGPNEPANIVCACASCNSSKFRGEAPGRWSRTVDRCRDCGTTDRKHVARGVCGACYQRRAKARATI